MAKYSEQEIKDMARRSLAARDSNDPRFVGLVMMLHVATSLEPGEVVMRIEALAR